jgi:hypothetical protein
VADADTRRERRRAARPDGDHTTALGLTVDPAGEHVIAVDAAAAG